LLPISYGPRLALADVQDAVASGGGTQRKCEPEGMKVNVALIGILMCTAALPAGAGEPEQMVLRVSPAVAFAPANLVVRTTIPANEQNRAVQIVAESDSFYRSSEVQLEGDHAPRTTRFEFRSLPPGSYEVRAIVLGTHGEERSSARQQVNVLASTAGH
jgi:hypothetical protein